MILLVAVLAGLICGLGRAWLGGRRFQVDNLKRLEFLIAASLLQALTFYFPPTRAIIPTPLAAFILVVSLACLLAFVWLNRAQPGFWILGLGLILNLLVIAANGGLMPLSPQIASQLVPSRSASAWETGARFGWSKDVILPQMDTLLWWLSDCLLSPKWFPRRVAFSPGDVMIALGAFGFLWARGGPREGVIGGGWIDSNNPNSEQG